MDNTHPIRTARQAKNLTQQQLAEKLGVTKAAVSQWELGNKMPQPMSAHRLCKVLPLTLNKIYAAAKPCKAKEAA